MKEENKKKNRKISSSGSEKAVEHKPSQKLVIRNYIKIKVRKGIKTARCIIVGLDCCHVSEENARDLGFVVTQSPAATTTHLV